eukprot:365989-Prymnesium_polylepis.1
MAPEAMGKVERCSRGLRATADAVDCRTRLAICGGRIVGRSVVLLGAHRARCFATRGILAEGATLAICGTGHCLKSSTVARQA